MKSFHHLILLGLVLLASATSAYAETRYISDVLVVTVRDQKGDNYNVLETLTTATPIEILEEDKTYVKVKTPKGTVGYILKQYITKELPKALQIKQLNGQVSDLQAQLDQLREKSQESLDTASQSQAQIDSLTKQLEQTRQELATVNNKYQQLLKNSENVVNLTTENEQLIEQNKLINSELLVLREENQNFHRSNMIQWFIAGAAVFFGGWLIGKISRKKQRGYSRL